MAEFSAMLYASTYYACMFYDWTTELSIYLHEDARGRGLEISSMIPCRRNLRSEVLRFLACMQS